MIITPTIDLPFTLASVPGWQGDIIDRPFWMGGDPGGEPSGAGMRRCLIMK